MEQKANNKRAVKVLGGIDSLYYFIKCDTELYHTFYESIERDTDFLCDYDGIKFLTNTGKYDGVIGFKYQYSANDIKIAAITFKDYKKQQKIHNVYVQLYAESIYSNGLKASVDMVAELLLNLFGLASSYNTMFPSRVDVNCFVGGFDFSRVSDECFAGSFHRALIKENVHAITRDRHTETLYLGSRTSKISFKIYDKLLELSQKMDNFSTCVKLAYLSDNGFGVDFQKDHLWNAEFSLKREYLTECNIYTLEMLFKSFKFLYFNCFANLDFYGFDVKKIANLRKSGHLNRLSNHPVWELMLNNKSFNPLSPDISWGDLPVERIVPKAKELSEKWAREKILSILNNADKMGWDFSDIFDQVGA